MTQKLFDTECNKEVSLTSAILARFGHIDCHKCGKPLTRNDRAVSHRMCTRKVYYCVECFEKLY